MTVSIITYELIRSVVVSFLKKQLDFLQLLYIKKIYKISAKTNKSSKLLLEDLFVFPNIDLNAS
ncbi:hypothetical protein EKL97_11640 [Flavobacterium sp. LS1P28]|uniref:hypothetical protein n=1 Tax=Flavobacterium sp. LS1P28 TaxID=2497752 RepID=UPI000F82C382|nr:hypothetical protein [Flavobacterium sp. LS1P28]RTY80033.1 hypothetical protein EKL97_11640 [Flavobacterium sp. LS1P28]RTY84754.1 hypothetical protein EKL99_01800 [Flavobacterium sp. ZB4P23]